MTTSEELLAQLPVLAQRTQRLAVVLQQLIDSRPGDDPAVVTTTAVLAAHNRALQTLTTFAGSTR